MDWHSRRISAILEHALLEDRATSDATSRACIDPQQRATATILAKQDCILSGVGSAARILEIYEHLDRNVIGHAEVISHGEIFDGVRLHKGQAIAVVRHNARALLSCERVILPRCGHAPHKEQPEEVLLAMTRFVRALLA